MPDKVAYEPWNQKGKTGKEEKSRRLEWVPSVRNDTIQMVDFTRH